MPRYEHYIDKIIRTQPSPNCLVCGNEGQLLYSDLSDGIASVEGKWNLKQCLNPNCASIWLDPVPIKEDIPKLYKNYVTHKAIKKKEALLLNILRGIFNFILYCNPERRRIDCMYLDAIKPGRLIDVGCGEGRRLVLMKSRGWHVVGQEVDPKSEAFSLGPDFKVYLGDLHNLNLPENSFDAVIMSHVIEHLLDPLAMLMECRRILKRGGHLVMVTPNSQSMAHDYFKKKWIGLDPPRHIFIFSAKSLKAIGLKAGFSECRIWTTCANTYGFARWSFLIERDRGREYQSIDILITLKAIIFSLVVTVMSFSKNKDKGDECVLFARK